MVARSANGDGFSMDQTFTSASTGHVLINGYDFGPDSANLTGTWLSAQSGGPLGHRRPGRDTHRYHIERGKSIRRGLPENPHRKLRALAGQRRLRTDPPICLFETQSGLTPWPMRANSPITGFRKHPRIRPPGHGPPVTSDRSRPLFWKARPSAATDRAASGSDTLKIRTTFPDASRATWTYQAETGLGRIERRLRFVHRLCRLWSNGHRHEQRKAQAEGAAVS